MTAGENVAGVAARLGLRAEEIEAHLQSVFTKLGLVDRVRRARLKTEFGENAEMVDMMAFLRAAVEKAKTGAAGTARRDSQRRSGRRVGKG